MGSRVLWVCGTLRHFIAKMTFFNVCHQNRLQQNVGDDAGGNPRARQSRCGGNAPSNSNPITFTWGFGTLGLHLLLVRGFARPLLCQLPAQEAGKPTSKVCPHVSHVLDAAQLSRVFALSERAPSPPSTACPFASAPARSALLGPNGAGKTTTGADSAQLCSPHRLVPSP